jgi:hypothetical protein
MNAEEIARYNVQVDYILEALETDLGESDVNMFHLKET